MAKLGVAIEETWDFFKEIFEDLGRYHELGIFERRQIKTPIFNERINRFLFHRDLKSLMAWSDVMFFEWASHLLAMATNMPKTCGIVTRLHRYEMYQWVDKVNWDAVDKIILVSEAKRAEFVAQFPRQQSKTEVIPVAVSLDKFRPHAKTYNGDIGILCHLTPRKLVYDLLMTFYDLIQENNAYHLHIAGGEHPAYGDYYFALRDAVTKLNLQDHVTFYGNVTDTGNWYKNIDIFISNSYSEGLQVAPMEAMAVGCFCLAHCWAGAEELLPQENLYVSGRDLNRKITAYAEEPTANKLEMKQRMREIVQANFDIEETKVRVRQVVESIGNQAA